MHHRDNHFDHESKDVGRLNIIASANRDGTSSRQYLNENLHESRAAESFATSLHDRQTYGNRDDRLSGHLSNVYFNEPGPSRDQRYEERSTKMSQGTFFY